MNLDQGIFMISSNQNNQKLLKKEIKTCENEQEFIKYNKNSKDLLYELLYYHTNHTNHNMKDTYTFLKSRKLGFRHPNFDTISKHIVEMDHFMDKPFEVVEGVNQCGKCGSQRTLSHSRQTRGGDEGMTVYVFCIDCKFRYVMNS